MCLETLQVFWLSRSDESQAQNCLTLIVNCYRRQDEDLEAMGQQVERLGQVGLTIHEELTTQQHMLDDLEEDIDITNNRMRAAQKKIAEVIRKSGGKAQFLTIIGLLVVLVILVAIAFG